jgi:hypothetical protein
MTTPEHKISEVRTIMLSPDERQVLRKKLYAYSRSYIPARGISVRAFQWAARHSIAAFGLAVLLIGSATSVSASLAQPGDALYGFRLKVNDRIQTALVRDEDAQIDVEMRQLQRMIDDEDALRDEELHDVGFVSEVQEIEPGVSRDDDDRDEEVEMETRPFDDGSFERELRSLERELQAEENASLELE